MDNDKIKTENQVESRLTPEMLGLVKRSTLENHQKQSNNSNNLNNNSNDNSNNEIKVPETKTNGNKPQSDDDDDIKIINEKINTVKQEPVRQVNEEEEKIEIKLKPEEFLLDDEEVGFPTYLKGWVTRGRTIPINKKTWTEIDIDGNDAILECPSQVVPLFIKKPHLFPPKVEKVNEKPNELKKDESVESKEDEKTVEAPKQSDDKTDEKSEEPKTDDKTDEKSDEPKTDEKSDEKSDEPKTDEKTVEAPKQSDDKCQQSQQPPPQSQLNEQQNKLTMLTIDDYYKSSVGTFLMGIGLRRCQETYLKESVKQTQKLIRKEGELDEHLDVLKEQQKQIEDCKSVNSIYTFKQEKCKMCDFKTDSESVMQHHLSIPHITNRKEYKCNFCTFLTRDARVIVYHFLNDHKKHCNIELPLNLYTCPTCNYESNQKAKAATHMAKCVKVFQEDKVLQTVDNESEHSAITSKLITQEDLRFYESTVQALKPVVMNQGVQIPFATGLPRGLQHQILIMQQQQFARQKLTKPKPAANNQRTNIRPTNIGNVLNPQNKMSTALATGINGSNLISNINFAKAPQLYHMLQTGSINNSQLLTNLQQQAKQNVLNTTVKAPQLNNRTIVPPINTATMVHKNLNNTMKSTLISKNVKDVNGANKPETFVICEICDGYIKDLEQLRTHMSWVHKVSID